MRRNRRIPAEAELIASIRSRAAKPGRNSIVSLGIGDDCAVLEPRRGEDIVVTTDLSIENVHFRRDWHPPQSVGHRCLARGLSDLASMGAKAEAAFLSLAMPRELTGTWLQGFLDGLLALGARHRVTLAGGDLAQSPTAAGGALTVADIVLLGSVPKGKALLRSGARPGDILYVTGALGGSAAELETLTANARSKKRARTRGTDTAGHPHLYPDPRLEAGRKLMLAGLATAAIDLSDGLSTDLDHLCVESGVAAEVDAQALPVDARASLDQALHGGEDYELLFTARPAAAVPARLGGVAIHAVGRITKPGRAPRVAIRKHDRLLPLSPGGWAHFR